MADLFAKVNCTYCQEEINGLRVQCCVCTDFDICLQCFACGAEIGPHKNDHAYKFVDHCAISIFGGRGSWTGREELQLLEAVELYGFGNWEFVSEYVQTRTPEEVRDEYVARYLDGNIGKATWSEVANKRPVLNDDVPEDNGPLSPAVTSRLPPLDATPEEAAQLNYMFHRDDYEMEYDMGAEQLVSSLQLNTAEDSNIEIALKLAHVDMYIRRLRERARRKRLVRDYQLVAKFFANQRKDASKRPLSKEQKEFRDRMRVFSQFLTAGEHERLISNIERERELRHRLSELLKYRSLGLTTQEDIIHFERHAAYQKQQQDRQRKTGSSGFTTTTLECLSKNGKNEEGQSSTEEKSMAHQEDVRDDSCSSNLINEDAVPPPLSISRFLSQHEMQLCKSLDLLPVQYLTLKALIIQDHLLTRGSSKPENNKPSDRVTVKDAVVQYLKEAGWLPKISI